MKRLFVALLAAVALLSPCVGCKPRQLPPITVYFSPKGGATEAVVEELDRAQKSILIQAYSFTSKPIAEALLQAHKRGVQIQVILDSSQKTEKYSEADFLLHTGVTVLIDGKHAIAHNKVIIVDDAVVVTGSFNFTKQAEHSNAENLLVIRDPELAQQYTENWRRHAAHSEPYLGKENASSDPPEGAPVTPASSGYISSPNSPLFHKSGCKSAARISEKNRVYYSTHIGAVLAGKKPCTECKP
jgi:phosphatidylserine/phosphatidylglycerophosphate/cardiolipin synthase-like enzyme